LKKHYEFAGMLTIELHIRRGPEPFSKKVAQILINPVGLNKHSIQTDLN
jgi:hypothetical protein